MSAQLDPETPTTRRESVMSPRPVSVTHLVFGLVFSGIALLWLVGNLTDADAPRFELAAPAVLIAAGVIGLAATFANSRGRRTRSVEGAEAPTTREEELS